jgi:hypothetical protein
MGELSALDFERLLLEETAARQTLFAALSKQPAMLALWCRWVQSQAALTDASRARRESEAHGG